MVPHPVPFRSLLPPLELTVASRCCLPPHPEPSAAPRAYRWFSMLTTASNACSPLHSVPSAIFKTCRLPSGLAFTSVAYLPPPQSLLPAYQGLTAACRVVASSRACLPLPPEIADQRLQTLLVAFPDLTASLSRPYHCLYVRQKLDNT